MMMDIALARELRGLVSDDGRVIPANMIEKKYLSDALARMTGSAEALVFPVSTAETSALMDYAYRRDIPVTARSAGTNLTGSTVPLTGGLVLDFSRMNRLLEIDAETFCATVEPGILLGEFQQTLEAQGLFYPPDPGEKTSAIGGNIATNAGGMRAVKYGVTRDYVRGLEIVKADGSVLNLGGKTVKDASGLSLKNLIVGSEGTLALITKCILKILPLPRESKGALAAFPSLEAGIAAVNPLLKSDPTAIEFLERDIVALGEKYTELSFPLPGRAAYLLLAYHGNSKNEIQERLHLAREICENAGAEDFLVIEDAAAFDRVWQIRGCIVKAVEAFSEQEPLDIVVPINRLSFFINFVHNVERESGLRMVSFGHAGDGNVHLCVIRGGRSAEEWERVLKEVMPLLYRTAAAIGGLVSGEHGIGIAKQRYFLENTAAQNIALMRQIKAVFDPKNLLNPGKSYHNLLS
ncbi:MAG: FAD-binding protein [Spirochaetaceae bacterium]|jgi:glycolate oxidase|nr:FAD-binding protein [Spirochaetaceae bacterium]